MHCKKTMSLFLTAPSQWMLRSGDRTVVATNSNKLHEIWVISSFLQTTQTIKESCLIIHRMRGRFSVHVGDDAVLSGILRTWHTYVQRGKFVINMTHYVCTITRQNKARIKFKTCQFYKNKQTHSIKSE